MSTISLKSPLKLFIRISFYRFTTDGKEKLYSVCFDDDRGSAIYSTHTIDLAGKGEFVQQ